MPHPKRPVRSPLPRAWPARVRSALLRVIALAQYAAVYTRSWAANSLSKRVRLQAENDRLRQEVALLQEEIRIKDCRLEQIDPHHRPHYPPIERMAILELRAARGWSQQQTAEVFHLTAATIASWIKRLDESGPEALVQLRQPVNRFPDFVRYTVQRLKILCPQFGKVKIAETLARAGLHLAPTTVGRILTESPQAPRSSAGESPPRQVTARHPNHVWHVDLTTVPTGGGLWAPWLPRALPQCWPFGWWVAVVLDHFSRRVLGCAVFPDKPSSAAIRTLLGRTIRAVGTAPKYVITDRGRQFWCAGFKAWCRRRGIRPRFGAIGQHGSIALIERFIGTLKREGLRRLLIPSRRETLRRDLLRFVGWYNGHRPHSALRGCTPDEIYEGTRPANRQPRIEPRERWPRSSRCAAPQSLVAGRPGAHFDVDVEFVDGRRHLPIITLKRAA